MTNLPSQKDLFVEATRLRDYLLHVDGQDARRLAAALRPFEKDQDTAQQSDKNVAELSDAFQTAHDDVLRQIDQYTISAVLQGDSPHKRGTPILNSLLLTIAGFFLVMAAFNFSYWANRATVAVAEAEQFLAFDHLPQLTRLIEMKHYFEKVANSADSEDLEPQLIYLEGIASLQDHYLVESTLPEKMLKLADETRFVQTPWQSLRDRTCDGAFGQTLPASLRSWANCFEPQPVPSITETNQDEANAADVPPVKVVSADTGVASDATVEEIVTAKAAPTPAASEPETPPLTKTFESPFEMAYSHVTDLQWQTMEKANRVADSLYLDSLHAVRLRMQELREALNAVHLWALPIIYGFLGSIVYCMWRVLHPNIAALGFFYSFMRTIFAGLAALTLSMLLVPSNILTAGVELNRPLIYLLSFIFGYSVEVFINTLNLLNSYFLSNLTTRPRTDKGAAA